MKTPIDVSIVIPTKNAGSVLGDVLKHVYGQKTQFTYEVICVDSGSGDQTLEIIGQYPAVLYQIKPEEFGHGKTRNYGASKGTGEFIVFITQDAVPADDSWLENMILAMKMDNNIAGGFGIHYPYPDCNILDKRDITLHFKGFGDTNTIYWLEDEERYQREEGYRHLLAYFSDNNSCLRRSIWEKYPYKDVSFAEDQIWAREIIEAGYKKVYCPFAPVYHSHNYKMFSYLGRSYDEQKGMYQLHGFVMVKKWYLVIPQAVKHILSDWKYIQSCVITQREKFYWKAYAFCRELCRYIGGYLGGHYAEYSRGKQDFWDKHISQQYRQIRR